MIFKMDVKPNVHRRERGGDQRAAEGRFQQAGARRRASRRARLPHAARGRLRRAAPKTTPARRTPPAHIAEERLRTDCMSIARAACAVSSPPGFGRRAALAAQAWEAGTDGLLPIPPLAARVTDLTQTLSAAETQALEAKLADWEARTSNQLAVLLVPTTQPEPIEAYSLRVAEKWKIGRKGQDNGALVPRREERPQDADRSRLRARRRAARRDRQSHHPRERRAAVPRRKVRRRNQRRRRPDHQRRRRREAASSPANETAQESSRRRIRLRADPADPLLRRADRRRRPARMFGRFGGSMVGGASSAPSSWFVAGSLLFGILRRHRRVHLSWLRWAWAAALRIAAAVASPTGGGWGGGGWWWRRQQRRRLFRRRRQLRRRRLVGKLVRERFMTSRQPRFAASSVIFAPIARRCDATFPQKSLAADRNADRRRRERASRASCALPSRRRCRSARVLHGAQPRERALEVFGSLGIWDTAENCGVLVYLLLADRDVEIVADRGIHAQVGTEAWESDLPDDGEGVPRTGDSAKASKRDSPRSMRSLSATFRARGGRRATSFPTGPCLL